MDMETGQSTNKSRLAKLAPAILLGGVTAVFAVISVLGSLHDNAADTSVWQELLRIHDRVWLTFGSNQLGSVYVTPERLLRRMEMPENTEIERAAAAVNAYAETQSASVFMLAVPTSGGIYSDTLPEAAPIANEAQILRHFSGALNDSVVWMEASSWLEAEREQYIYYRTDPCWTGYGAYCVYRSTIRRLGFHAVGYDQFSVRHCNADYYGRLAEEAHFYDITPDLVDIYTPAAPQTAVVTALRQEGNAILPSYYQTDRVKQHPDALYALATEPVLQIQTNHMNSKDLLLLTDCYGAAIVPFLMQHYRTVTAVNMTLTGGMNWRALTDGDYAQVLILCGADTVAKPDALVDLLGLPDAEQNEAE